MLLQTVAFCYFTAEANGLRMASEPTDINLDEESSKSNILDAQLSDLLGAEVDLHPGEAEFIISEVKRVKPQITEEEFTKWLQNGRGVDYNMTGRIILLWHVALEEEKLLGKDMSIISDYARATPKYPRSWVNKITQMNGKKEHRYMFSGSFVHLNRYRHWLGPWVKEHFHDEDYFRATDGKDGHGKYKPMGSWDRTLQDPGGFRPKGCHSQKCEKTGFEFDKSYWSIMKTSRFIMCPGGDAPYSFRFYETALAGAIPILNSFETDWNKVARPGLRWVSSIGYENFMTSGYPHTYDDEMAKRNMKKFIRYQTWLEGDNDPVRDQKNGFKF